MEGGIVAWGLSPGLVGLAQKTISETRVPRVSFQRSSFVIAYLVCVTQTWPATPASTFMHVDFGRDRSRPSSI